MSCNLTRVFIKTVDAVFKTFSDFIVSGDVVLPASGYNTVTGQTTGTETVYPIAEIIFIDYELSKIDGQIIRKLDKNALFRVSEITPAVTDEMLLRVDSVDWDIINIEKYPSDVLYNIQVRRP